MWERPVGQLLFVLNYMYGFQLHGHRVEVPASPVLPTAVLLAHLGSWALYCSILYQYLQSYPEVLLRVGKRLTADSFIPALLW